MSDLIPYDTGHEVECPFRYGVGDGPKDATTCACHQWNQPMWPMQAKETKPPIGTDKINPEDIASYAYPEGERERYTESGWQKALKGGYAIIRNLNDLPSDPLCEAKAWKAAAEALLAVLRAESKEQEAMLMREALRLLYEARELEGSNHAPEAENTGNREGSY